MIEITYDKELNDDAKMLYHFYFHIKLSDENDKEIDIESNFHIGAIFEVVRFLCDNYGYLQSCYLNLEPGTNNRKLAFNWKNEDEIEISFIPTIFGRRHFFNSVKLNALSTLFDELIDATNRFNEKDCKSNSRKGLDEWIDLNFLMPSGDEKIDDYEIPIILKLQIEPTMDFRTKVKFTDFIDDINTLFSDFINNVNLTAEGKDVIKKRYDELMIIVDHWEKRYH